MRAAVVQLIPAGVRGVLIQAQSISLATYCLLATVVAVVGAVAAMGVGLLIHSLLGVTPTPVDSDPSSMWLEVLETVAIAPLVESLLLAGMLAMLTSWELSRTRAAVIAALLWGVMHGLKAPMAFFGPAWGFLVFSAGYLMWRPVSFRHAFAAAAIPHALYNGIVMVVDAVAVTSSAGA
ncbi:hypothetical protein [Lysobacter olei]